MQIRRVNRAYTRVESHYVFLRRNAVQMVRTASIFLTALFALICAAPLLQAQPMGVYHEIYLNLTGSSLSALTNTDSNFPNLPDVRDTLTTVFETPVNYGDRYGQRLRALIVPPVTGTYVFWIAADQVGTLFLSPDESPFNKTQIAYLTNSVIYDVWYTRPSQQSTNIYLEAGRRYYIEALHVSYNGIRDFASVGWKLPDGTLERPIPASRVIPFGMPAVSPPALTQQPTNVTVLENSPVTFRVGISNLDVVNFQWQRNGTNLVGANGASYTIAQVGTNDNGATFSCVVSNNVNNVPGVQTSASASLTVITDTTRPALIEAANASSNLLQVLFSEPVEPASATNLFNYAINNGITIARAAIGASPRAVSLTTSPFVYGSNYTVTVSNVRDLAAARNTIVTSSQQSFRALLKGIYLEVFTNVPGRVVSDLTNNPAFPNNPSIAQLMTNQLETTPTGLDNYGQRFRACIIPPLTGSYTFWVAATETATLSLGTNDTPVSARQIASVTGDAEVAPHQYEVQPNQRSSAISLVAGQQYYIEVLMKVGIAVSSPPDHLSVRWQLPDGSIEEAISAVRLIPVGLNPPLIAMQPTNATVVEATAATFTVAVSNPDPITYQWQKNGTNLPGATNASYTTSPARLADSGASFQCLLGNPMGSTNTVAALLTVTADVTPPAIVNVLNSASNRVVVFFSEPVEAASSTNAGNYTIPGVTLSAAVLSSDNRSVTLTSTPLTSGNSYTITVNGVRDQAATPNTIGLNSQWTFLAGAFFPQDIGAAPLASSITYRQNGVDIAAGGAGTSGTNDQFNLTAQQFRGDFDVKVRVQRLDFVDPWTVAGLMAREDLSTNSRFAAVFSTPSITGTFFQYRTNAGTVPQFSGMFPANYPNTWLRLQRVGGTRFTGYASYDGQTWTQLGVVFLQLPATVYLGFAVSSQNPSQLTLAQFRDLSNVTAGLDDKVGLLPVPIEPLGPSSRNCGLTFTEIMYHPAPRTDGRDIEYIEMFNSNPFPEDISGYRISGDVSYTFPPGTVMQGGAFLVIAHNPADVTAVYGISNVIGPYSKRLSHSSGSVRLRNPIDALFLDVTYDSKPPWPLAADGAGHSLVLARPSYGQGEVRAWSQSDAFGGSPGRGDGITWDGLRNVVINEFVANSSFTNVDYIELYNHSTTPVDVSGCWLSDTPAVNKFRIPDGTIIGPTGFVYFTEADFNPIPGAGNSFALNAGGEAIYLVNSNQTRVVDSILFEGQEQDVSTGRVPDGGPAWQRLAAKTPGAPNGPIRAKSIVINELMYSPISGDNNDQYVELYNRSTNTVNLGNWQFTSGIGFTFPTNTLLAPNGYLVVAKNAAHLMTNYPTGTLTTNNTLGNFTGKLNDGERTVLSMPIYEVKTNLSGVVTTNTFYADVDEVTFQKGGRWGLYSDAGGSSLELIDPDSDNRLAPNWADSDETTKGAWTTISYTGILDNPNPNSAGMWNALQIMLLEGPSECLVDNLSVTIAGGTNLVPNRTFESGINGWIFQGDHYNSYWGNSGDGSSHSLHIVATDRGEETANYVFTILSSTYTTGVTGTITARVKWLAGWPEILFRLRGGHLEASGPLAVPTNLGTPGAPNSRRVTNAGPAITGVTHSPVAPAANQPVVVTALVHDPDGVTSVQLNYRIDPFGTTTTITMVDDGTGGDAIPGDGIYSATIPAPPTDTPLVAFYIRARDGFSPAATATFPADAPKHECLVRFGDPSPILTYGTYHLWLTQANVDRWLTEGCESNDAYDLTFAYGNRVIYNASSHYGSSPAHRPSFDSPVGTNASYKLNIPPDDLFLGDNGGRIEQPGNGGADPSCLLEQIAYRVGEQLGQPYNYFRAMNMFINGVQRGICMTDVTRESGGWTKTWYPNNSNGDLYKIGFWYEFFDDGVNHKSATPTLQPVLTTNLTTHQVIKKLDPYRLWFRKRAIQDSANNFTNIFNLVDTVNTTATGDGYVAKVAPVIDFTQWARCWATERIDNNQDLYGNVHIYKGDKLGGQNCYIYKPSDTDPWQFLLWDVQVSFAGTPVDPLFTFSDPPMSNLFAQPLMLRLYWQALEDAANGVLMSENLFPWVDARYNAFQRAGIKTGSPDKFKSYLSVRRDYILTLLAGVRVDFAILSNGGNDFTNGSTLVTLAGSAPISARTITINGVSYPLSWSSITNWSFQLALSGQTNRFVVQAYDASGNLLSNASRSITVYFNGPISRPEDSLVINEIMYRPAISNASYVEIYNRSTNTTFSLLNYRLQGIDFNFTPGTFINPLGYLVAVKDTTAFQSAYGSNATIAGEFNGNLDPGGETLTLIKKGLTTNDADIIINKVKYDSVPPWSTRAAITNSGVALQVVDSTQDNSRVSNWDDGSSWRFFSFTAKPSGTSSPRLFLWLDGANDIYIDDIRLVLGSVAGAGSNYLRNADFETPLVSPWTLTGSPGPCTNSTAYAHLGSNSLHLVFTTSGGTSTCLYQDLGVSITSSSNYTVSFWYRANVSATRGTNLTVRLASSSGSSTSFSPVVPMRGAPGTPGSPNSVAGTVTPYPLLWLNEVQPNNVNGLKDNTGTAQPWVEIFNSGTTNITLDGYYLANSYNNLAQWAFPTGSVILPGQFRIVFVDGQPQLSTGTVLHTSFRLDPTAGSIALSRGQQIIDYLNYTNMEPDLSYGAYPDGQLFDRQVFYFVTPGSSNNPAPIPIAINEWMASNKTGIQNPANLNKFDDWFELYNFGSATINLSGYYLTDVLGNKNMWRIPDGVVMAPHSFLLCWADSNTNPTNTLGNAVHVNFQLSKSGDQIGLFSPGGIKVDSVTFGAQTTDVSQGRYPDGNVNGVYYSMPTYTPRANNVITNNLYPPVLSAIPDSTVNEGALLTFTAHATDADVPAQTLSYSLLAGAPDGAAIDPASGVFTWVPLETQGGSSYPITVSVSDNAGPPMSDAKTFNVFVSEVNSPPVISSIPDQIVDPGNLLTVNIPASDPDLPLQSLTFALLSGPAGANLDVSGRFTWKPTQAQALSTNPVVVAVTDSGALSATQSFTVFVTIGNPCTGYKGDVRDDGFVSISDWVLVGKYVADTNLIVSDCQFAKVDSAPRSVCGNGVIGVTDWVQAGRYAAGFDPLVSCGTVMPPPVQPFVVKTPNGPTLRSLVISDMTLDHGETKCMQIRFNPHGDENGLGWSITFDPNVLTYVSATFNDYATNAIFPFINEMSVADGKLGFAFLLASGDTFPSDPQVLAEICFRAADGSALVSTPVNFGDSPIRRGGSDANGNSLLATTGYTNGTVTVNGVGGGGVSFAGIVPAQSGQMRLTLAGTAGGIYEVQVSSNLVQWATAGNITNITGTVDFLDTVSTNAISRFYRAIAR